MTWTEEELTRIGRADELEVASRRSDGTLRPFVTIWGVRVGDDLFVRSAYGTDNPWFKRALTSREGRIRADGIERDVTFEDPADGDGDAITAAYHAKYDQYGPAIVGTVVSEDAIRSTLRVVGR
jgi:hypothetical protein